MNDALIGLPESDHHGVGVLGLDGLELPSVVGQIATDPQSVAVFDKCHEIDGVFALVVDVIERLLQVSRGNCL